MRKEVTVTICDICGNDVTNDNYRTETVRLTRGPRTYHYCMDCFWKHATECDVCGDHYVQYDAHRAGDS